jgi:hypothetical protein
MTTNVVFNTNKGVTSKQGVWYVITMKDTLPYLPALNYNKGSSMAILQMNVEYSDIELCAIV